VDVTKYIEKGKLSLIVKAGASKNKIVGWDNEKKALRVEINAKAESGKANLEIVKFFSKLVKTKVSIIIGKTGKRKVLAVNSPALFL